MWEKHYDFPHKTLLIAIMFPHIVFFTHVFFYDFFQNYLSISFFNTEMVENLILYFFLLFYLSMWLARLVWFADL